MLTAERFNLDTHPFFQILHALFREDGSDDELIRSRKALQWLLNNGTTVLSVFTAEERDVMNTIKEYHSVYAEPPTRAAFEIFIKTHEKHKPILEVLAAYDKEADNLPTIEHTEMSVHLDMRIKDQEAARFKFFAQQALLICDGAMAEPMKKGERVMSGPRDAVNFIIEKSNKEIFASPSGIDGGYIEDLADDMDRHYAMAELAASNNSLYIKTGLDVIDKTRFGFRRGEFVGVLGFAGARKSGMLRSISYHIASQGFSVLHIPLESEVFEETAFYASIHSKSKEFPPNGIGKTGIYNGNLAPDDKRLYEEQVKPSFEALLGNNLRIMQFKTNPSWEMLRSLILTQHSMKPIDFVVVDYLSMVSTPNSRNPINDINDIIQEVKVMTLANQWVFATPVQGNRNGYKDATNADGKWDKTGVGNYSMFEKSLDLLLYVFSNDDLSAINKVKMGSCKDRRGPDIPLSILGVDPYSLGFLNDALQPAESKKESGHDMLIPDFDFV